MVTGVEILINLDWHDVSAADGKTAFLQEPRAHCSFRGHSRVFGRRFVVTFLGIGI